MSSKIKFTDEPIEGKVIKDFLPPPEQLVNVKDSLPAAIHPGEFLIEILKGMNISQTSFAKAIGVSPKRISHIIKKTRPVTAEMALLIGQAFNQSPQYWLNLQTAYDLKTAEATMGERLANVRTFPHS